ncbi:MAG: ChaN family lipoprotein, partial [Myxococcales bacterium]|nr:ChaN family lipoprotein [Myxococcales bacterium]
PYQGPLDEWSAGRIDERELLRETEYEDRWGFDFDFYRPLLDLGKEHGTPLFAINAAKETTRAIAHGGLQALDPLQLSELPELEMNDREHFRLIESSISKNATMAPAAMRNYYAAQVVWDETMAFHVARIVNGRGAPDCLVVLAGHLRIQGGHGIPLRAARRGARPWQSVLPVDPDSDLARWSGPASERPADFLWIIPPPPP